MDSRLTNQHTEDDDAWKKRNIAFANYYTSRQAHEKVEHDFAASREGKNRTENAEIKRQREKALLEEKYKLATGWIKINRKFNEGDELLDSETRIVAERITKLKDPGDYQEANSNDINSGFTLRYGPDGSIRPFSQKVNSPGHEHLDPNLNMMGVLKTNWNWKSNYNKVFDFAASQCGASAVTIDFDTPGHRSLGRMQQLLDMAEERQMEVKLGDHFIEYLGNLTSNGNRSDASKAAAIYERVREVNKKADERKNDPEFLNSVEASMLEQYGEELQNKEIKLPEISGDDAAKTQQKTKFEAEIAKKKDGVFQYDETLTEIEKQMTGVANAEGKKTGGFEERAKKLASAEKELATQLETRSKDFEKLAELETARAANQDNQKPGAAKISADLDFQIEELKERITRLGEGEPGNAIKVDLRKEMVAGIEAETHDLKTRGESMLTTLDNMKKELETTAEKDRTEEQKKQLAQIGAYEKTLKGQTKTLNGYLAPAGDDGKQHSKLQEKNQQLDTDVNNLQHKTPRAGMGT